MVNMFDKLMEAALAVDFASKFNVSRSGFLAQWCSNKGGRYVTIVEYGGRRKVGAMMVPEGKHGHGWQILNRIFIDVVSFFHLSSWAVKSQGSSGIRQDVTFAMATKGLVVVTGDAGQSSVFLQTSGDGAADITLSKINSLLESKEHELDEKCPAVLSKRELASFNGVDLLVQIMGFRKDVDRLLKMLSTQSQGGRSDLEVPELKDSSQLIGALVSSEPKVWESSEQPGGSKNMEGGGLSCRGDVLCTLGLFGHVGDVVVDGQVGSSLGVGGRVRDFLEIGGLDVFEKNGDPVDCARSDVLVGGEVVCKTVCDDCFVEGEMVEHRGSLMGMLHGSGSLLKEGLTVSRCGKEGEFLRVGGG
ncbi:hypothetical protein CJ030_MR3G001138 [Morella rubra]|uniref:Uncharacterized protein n=1 Tax=Morella rubra TaxID=262757 RepID=A0A6A1W2A3_9ROSI|nr:hypothetical protein CJ030_MR3G001138 [Morella rubra]